MAVTFAVIAEKEEMSPTRRISQNSRPCSGMPVRAGVKPSLPRHSARAYRSAEQADVVTEEAAGPAMPRPGQSPMPSARMPLSGTCSSEKISM